MSRGYLNNYAEELSPYNSLPFRNRQIIGDGRRNAESISVDTTQYPQIVSGSSKAGSSKDLNTLFTIPSVFGGYQSGSDSQNRCDCYFAAGCCYCCDRADDCCSAAACCWYSSGLTRPLFLHFNCMEPLNPV
jgi:hypothetical protein